MKTKWVLLLGAIGVVLVVIAYQKFRRSSEPYYDGEPLSFWVASLGRFDVKEPPKSIEAVDHIGVEAVPYLLRWMQYESPGWRERLASRLYASRWRLVQKAGEWVWSSRSQQLWEGRYAAFTVLGQRANPAFGQLCRVLDNTNLPQGSCGAALALGAIGTNSLPVLVRAAVTPGHPARMTALSAMKPYGRVAVGAITNFLGGTNDFRVQITAIESLWMSQMAPDVSISALIGCLGNGNPNIRKAAASGLGVMGWEATNAAPALSNALTDADPGVRAAARDALRQIAPRLGSNESVRLGSGHEK